MKLLELAATWEEWAERASSLADHTDPTTAATLRAKAEQAIEDATALRNHVADHPEETAKPRTYTVALPASLPLLNANQRWHFADRADYTRGIRQAARLLAADIPAMKRAHIIAEYRPGDRRRRDVHNFYPSAKAAVDGLVDAGVLPDDSDEYLVGPDMRVGEVEPAGGRLLLHVTELEVLDGAA